MSLTPQQQAVLEAIEKAWADIKAKIEALSQVPDEFVTEVNNKLEAALEWLATHGQQPGTGPNDNPEANTQNNPPG